MPFIHSIIIFPFSFYTSNTSNYFRILTLSYYFVTPENEACPKISMPYFLCQSGWSLIRSKELLKVSRCCFEWAKSSYQKIFCNGFNCLKSGIVVSKTKQMSCQEERLKMGGLQIKKNNKIVNKIWFWKCFTFCSGFPQLSLFL